MSPFALAIFCVAIVSVSAGWHAPSGVVATHGGDAVVAGPSGSISTSNGHGWAGHGAWGGYGTHGWAAPAWNGLWQGAWNGAHGTNGAWNGALWNGAHGVWNGAHAWAGSGHEGQWVPDGSEAHYDDGSYRPEHHYSAHGAAHDW